MCDQIHAAAALKPDVKSGLGVTKTTRSGRRTAVVATVPASGASQDKSKSEDRTARGVRREGATERVAGGMVNEKASVRAAKQEESDQVVSLASHARGAKRVNLAKASHTGVLAMRAAHQDQDVKSVIGAAEVEVGVLAMMYESDLASLQTSRTET